jgi:hypothetical protein
MVEQDGIGGVGVERGVEVDQIDRLIGDVVAQDSRGCRRSRGCCRAGWPFPAAGYRLFGSDAERYNPCLGKLAAELREDREVKCEGPV